MANNFGVPPAPGQINYGNYDAQLPMTGLAALTQGFTKGIELGHDWNAKAAEHQSQHELKLETMKQRGDYQDMMNLMKERALNEKEKTDATAADFLLARTNALNQKTENVVPAGQPISITDPNTGKNVTMVSDGKGGFKDAFGYGKAGLSDKDHQKHLASAAAAYNSMDEYAKIAGEYLPKSSGILGSAAAIPEMLASHLMKTSGPSRLASKSKEAATIYAASHNSMGSGARMSDAEINNMAKAMGGEGIGETHENILGKIDGLKADLALKGGVTREEVEAYIAEKRQGGTVTFKDSDGETHTIPKSNLAAAQKRDPGLKVVGK